MSADKMQTNLEDDIKYDLFETVKVDNSDNESMIEGYQEFA
jgi:hypothetical protein